MRLTSGKHQLNRQITSEGDAIALKDARQKYERLRSLRPVILADAPKNLLWLVLAISSITTLLVGVTTYLVANPVAKGTWTPDGFSQTQSLNPIVLYASAAGFLVGIAISLPIARKRNKIRQMFKQDLTQREKAAWHELKRIETLQSTAITNSVNEYMQELAGEEPLQSYSSPHSNSHKLFYCTKFFGFVDVNKLIAHIIATCDCREVLLQTSSERTQTVSGGLSSARKSATGGAILGWALLGESGLAPGAIVGASVERDIDFEITEVSTRTWEVDVFTRIPTSPTVTIEFSNDRDEAKRFYALISMGIEGSQISK